MNTLGVVFEAEFSRRIKSRAFIAGTIIGALGILMVATLPATLGSMMSSSTKKVVLAGDPALTSAAARLLKGDFQIVRTVREAPAHPTLAFLDAQDKASALAVLSRGADGLHVLAFARDPSAFRDKFARDLAPLQIALATGVAADRVAAHVDVKVDIRDLSGRFADPAAAYAAKGIAYLFVMLLYLSILLNTQSIMTSVAEEKTSRIAELLVATIDPARLLAAKVLAAAATGFIQLGVWIVMGLVAGRAVITMFARDEASATSAPVIGTLDVSSVEIVAFLAFFAVGFAQYGVLYAAAASLINRTEDLGSVAGPLVIPVVAAIVIAQMGLQFPTNPSVVAFSMVPLISPFVMFTRVAVSNVPLWQLILSFTLNVAVAIFLAWLGGHVYRVGLLMYGRAPLPRQILAVLRQR